MPNLYLNFYGNGPYWSDFIHLLADPKGVSYVHPFRYDEKYVEESLRQKINNKEIKASDDLSWLDEPSWLNKIITPKKVTFEKVTIGCRFDSPEHKKLMLPIRSADLTLVKTETVYLFYFRVLDFFDFTAVEELIASATTLNDDYDGLLAFTSNAPPELKIFEPGSYLEGDNWKKLVDLIGKDKTLPIREEARRSIFTRVSMSYLTKDRSVPIKKIEKSASSPSIYGMQLYQGVKYNVAISYRVPFLSNKKTTIGDTHFLADSSNKDVSLSASQIPFVGNYGSEYFSLFSNQATGIATKLQISPPEESESQPTALPSSNSPAKISGTTIHLPYKVGFSLRYWLLSSLIPTIILFISILVLSLSNVALSKIDKFWEGKVTIDIILSNWMYLIPAAIFAAIATIAIQYSNSKTK